MGKHKRINFVFTLFLKSHTKQNNLKFENLKIDWNCGWTHKIKSFHAYTKFNYFPAAKLTFMFFSTYDFICMSLKKWYCNVKNKESPNQPSIQRSTDDRLTFNLVVKRMFVLYSNKLKVNKFSFTQSLATSV